MKASRSTGALLLALALVMVPAQADAKPTVAVLAFGGDNAKGVRGDIIRPLRRNYRVVHGDQVLDACDELGIAMSRGRNLARCAKRAGVVAVVGGAIKGGKLNLVVFSGNSGNVIGSGSVTCRRRLSTAGLRDALSVIMAGLRKAPGRRKVAPPPKPDPPPRPKPKPKPKVLPDLEYDPNAPEDPDDGSNSGDFNFDPEPVEQAQPKQPTARTNSGEEDPLEDPDKGKTSTTTSTTTTAKVTKKPKGDGYPRMVAMVGLGTWIRQFSINDPARNIVNPKTGKPYTHPGYDSSAAFALRLGTKLRPAAFFTDGFASWLYLRAQFQTTLGLQSRTKEKDSSGQPIEKAYGTAFMEFLLDLGVDVPLGKAANRPHLEGGLGFGIMDFGISWETDPPHTLPDVSYAFFLLKAGFNWPFHKFVGAHFNFDFRAVGSSGEVEDEADWYGPSTTNGINIGLGLDGKYKGWVASLEYTYTRYFYAFDTADQRVTDKKRAAGGALDILHGVIISGGYSF